MTTIEITQEKSTFNVNLKFNSQQIELIGYQINSFREAIKLAETYKSLDSSIRIEVSPQAKEAFNPYKEMDDIVATIGLPPNSFNGLVDAAIQYRDLVEPKERSVKGVLDMFKANKTIN